MGPPGSGSAGPPAAGVHTRCQNRFKRIWEAAVAFREVGVHEIREVLRLWLRGEGFRAAGRIAQVDRKTVRRYVAAGLACGLDPALGEGQLGDELLAAVAERVRPHRGDGHAPAWALLAAHHAQFKAMVFHPTLTVLPPSSLLAPPGALRP